jgi:CBS domain containing-hemolysin-like protein
MPADDPSRPQTAGKPGAKPWTARVGAVLIRLGRRIGGRIEDAGKTAQSIPGPVDIVGQAQAFKSLRVYDLMTPRADIVALDLATPFEEVVRHFAEAEHSRMPIYRETLDEPIGLVNIRDVFKLLRPPADARRPGWKEPVLRRLKREILYVPASMGAADLLVRMQASRIHMAVVIDEFGGTDGLVTLEDVIEAVVGEIDDEYDEAPSKIAERPGGVYETDGRAPLEALEAVLGVGLSPADLEEGIETVAGLVSAVAGRLPQRGEVIAHPAGFEFEITDADPRRVKRVRIRPAKSTLTPQTKAPGA